MKRDILILLLLATAWADEDIGCDPFIEDCYIDSSLIPNEKLLKAAYYI